MCPQHPPGYWTWKKIGRIGRVLVELHKCTCEDSASETFLWTTYRIYIEDKLCKFLWLGRRRISATKLLQGCSTLSSVSTQSLLYVRLSELTRLALSNKYRSAATIRPIDFLPLEWLRKEIIILDLFWTVRLIMPEYRLI